MPGAELERLTKYESPFGLIAAWCGASVSTGLRPTGTRLSSGSVACPTLLTSKNESESSRLLVTSSRPASGARSTARSGQAGLGLKLSAGAGKSGRDEGLQPTASNSNANDESFIS